MQPHSPASEQTLLGLILLDNKNFDLVSGQLPASDFYVPLYAAIYEAMAKIIADRREANPMTIVHQLDAAHGDKQSLIMQMVGMLELAGSCTHAPSVAYVVSELAYQRKLISAADQLSKAANANQVEVARQLQGEIALLTASFVKTTKETPLNQLSMAYKAACEAKGMMPTGFKVWDDIFGGLFAGNRYTIAGHAGAGKSAMALYIAWNMAKQGKRVRWLSYEEKPDALWWRILAREAKVPVHSFRMGLTEAQKVKVINAQAELQGYDFLGFYGLPDVPSMIGNCGECDLIVLDGVSSAPAPGANTKVDKAGIVGDYCQLIAQKTGAAVIMLSHVNSDSIKGGASATGLYGGQAATFDPEGIVDLRWADDSKTICTMQVIKNRYGNAGKKVNIYFDGQFQTYNGEAV